SKETAAENTKSKKAAEKKSTPQKKSAKTETPNKSSTDKTGQTPSEDDGTMKLHGGEEGTIFKSLRIEGEDRVRIEFERPPLNVDLDLKDAPGLEWEGIHTVIDKSSLDLVSPYFDRTGQESPPLFARPWLYRFSSDAVARFRPALEGVERWRLVVANSQGKTVKTFDGKGKPPKDIPWDGRDATGKPVPPGLTYSYVLEAFDKAGNKRNFVGDGFELPSYRVATKEGLAMLFAGDEMHYSREIEAGGKAPAPAIILEAASWINQAVDKPVRIEVTARTFQDAKNIAKNIERSLNPLLLGDPLRVQSTTNVVPDAPDPGTIAIVIMSQKRIQKAEKKAK
ncbi:MAG: hypothetical protein OEN01_10820, partial [Candidatus Krumholzibacteria bacterium]|nr:hypothetical protein [Candidatus Krumholzibacteria bacterium]